VIFRNGIYYWYGTHKIEGLSECTHADGGVHVYASLDLLNWHDQGMVLRLAGDFAMFQDDNGNLVHLAVRKPDKAFVMGGMREDYLMPEGPFTAIHAKESIPTTDWDPN